MAAITGRRGCSHSNFAGGWTLLRKLGAAAQLEHKAAAQLRLVGDMLMHGGRVSGSYDTVAAGMLDGER